MSEALVSKAEKLKEIVDTFSNCSGQCGSKASLKYYFGAYQLPYVI